MKLDALSSGNAKSVVSVLRGEVIENTPLLGCHYATWDSPANHHDELLACLAQVSIILLINPVKFKKLLIVSGKRIKAGVVEGSRNSPCQSRIRLFDFLVVR